MIVSSTCRKLQVLLLCSERGVCLIRDRITINKNLIPYSFDITLSGEVFEIGVKYNEFADMFTLTVYLLKELLSLQIVRMCMMRQRAFAMLKVAVLAVILDICQVMRMNRYYRFRRCKYGIKF